MIYLLWYISIWFILSTQHLYILFSLTNFSKIQAYFKSSILYSDKVQLLMTDLIIHKMTDH